MVKESSQPRCRASVLALGLLILLAASKAFPASLPNPRASGPAGPAAVAAHTTIAGIWVDGSRSAEAVGMQPEISFSAESTVQVAVACQPPRFDARYLHQVEGTGDWTPPSTNSTFRVSGLEAGAYRLLITCRSAVGAWKGDTVSVVLRVTAASGERGPAASRARAGGLLGIPVLWILGIALLVGIGTAIIVLRLPHGGNTSVPPGAVLVVDATEGATRAAESRERTRKSSSKKTVFRGTPADEVDPFRVPSRTRPSGGEVDSEARARVQELEHELQRLRKRISEIIAGARNLKRNNVELREKCSFLERSNRALRELQQRKEEIMAALAHDIKNPAGAIQNLAEIMQSYDLSMQDQQKMVADILLTSSRIIKLSQEMTEIMVSEVRSLPLEIVVGSIRDAVEHVLKVNRIMAGKKGITVLVNMPAALPRIEMDAPRIEEVLDNLLSNAVKYSKPGSKVRVDVKNSTSHVTIDVSDSGAGISQGDLQQAFEFGRKLSTQPTAGETSSGLGLWIVRKIVEAHHGVIWVKSAPGKGSCFSVMLPLKQPSDAAA